MTTFRYGENRARRLADVTCDCSGSLWQAQALFERMLEFDDNIGKEWSAVDLVDLHYSIERGLTVAETACFLKRTDAEVRKKAAELGIDLD
jgi:hypothetical protein